jgi:hypothetical protein
MNGEHLDILVIAATVAVFVLDPKVWEVDPIIEVRQLMLPCPCTDFFLVTIWMPVVVVAPRIVLMEPLLIVPLQLVIEHHAVDASALFVKAVRCMEIGVIDVRIVFELTRSFEARVIGLAGIPIDIAMTLKNLSASLR